MRVALFAALAAALLAALLLALAEHPAPTPPASPIVLVSPRGPKPSPSTRSSPSARPAARRFLRAFLAREVGKGGAAGARAIRTGAAAALARELLAAPHRAHAGPPPARLTDLRITPLPGRPRLRLATATARRPSGPEPLSFLFARRGGRWLAIAPGE